MRTGGLFPGPPGFASGETGETRVAGANRNDTETSEKEGIRDGGPSEILNNEPWLLGGVA
jgi:hypothetical protein